MLFALLVFLIVLVMMVADIEKFHKFILIFLLSIVAYLFTSVLHVIFDDKITQYNDYIQDKNEIKEILHNDIEIISNDLVLHEYTHENINFISLYGIGRYKSTSHILANKETVLSPQEYGLLKGE